MLRNVKKENNRASRTKREKSSTRRRRRRGGKNLDIAFVMSLFYIRASTARKGNNSTSNNQHSGPPPLGCYRQKKSSKFMVFWGTSSFLVFLLPTPPLRALSYSLSCLPCLLILIVEPIADISILFWLSLSDVHKRNGKRKREKKRKEPDVCSLQGCPDSVSKNPVEFSPKEYINNVFFLSLFLD